MLSPMNLLPIHLALFQAWCALLILSSSWSTDCRSQLNNNSYALNSFDLIEVGKRSHADSLLYTTAVEAVLIALFSTKSTALEFDTSNRNFYIKALLLLLLTLVRIRRAGFFGMCLENDDMCCGNCDNNADMAFRIDSTTCNTPNSIPRTTCYEHRSWSDPRHYCPVPAYFFDCRSQSAAVPLHRIPDNSQCYNWGCNVAVSPLRAVMSPMTTLSVIVSMYLF